MGLDIYAGTLTRYYTRNWKTITQQWAEQNGYGFRVVRPDGSGDAGVPQAAPEEVRRYMETWRDNVLQALQSPDAPLLQPWLEDHSDTPYFTKKPDWDAFGALLLAAACAVYGEPAPAAVEKGWNYVEHPLIVRMGGDREHVWSLFRGAEWWLPLDGGFLFRVSLPGGEERAVATVRRLHEELDRINALLWQAGEDEILNWETTEGYPADGSVDQDGHIDMGEDNVHTRYDTQSLAKYAFSLFWQAVRFAETHRTPLLLDY